MKILFVNFSAQPIPPAKGGAVENLVDFFIRHNEVNKKHDITVVSIYDKEAEILAKNYKHAKFIYIKLGTLKDKTGRIIRYAINRFSKIYVGSAYLSKAMAAIKDEINNFDVVIVENAPEYGLILQKFAKGKLVLHLHNDLLNDKTKRAKKIFGCYKAIFTISDFLKEKVNTISHSDKVYTLYNGMDVEYFKNYSIDKSKVRAKYGIKDDDFVILYSGRLVPEKGVKELLLAFSKLENKNNLKMVIAGSARFGKMVKDKYFFELQKIASQCGGNVIFTGYIPYDSMPQLYKIADIGVIPSLCNDSFNMTVIEYLACGVPIIISDMGAMHEIAGDECAKVAKTEGNFVLNLKNEILSLINSENERERLSKKGLERVMNFNKDNYCDSFNYLLNYIFGGQHEFGD